MAFSGQPDFSSVLPEKVLDAVPVSGGDIGSSYRVKTEKSDYFIKRYSSAGLPGMEAAGINAMAATKTISVPEVISFDDHFLVLKFIKQAPRCGEFQTLLGRGLAEMHRVSAEQAEHREIKGFGFNEDNYIGTIPQKNTACDNWTDFLIANRLGYQIRLAADSALTSAWNRLSGKIPRLLAGTEEPPSLIHGDLWGGNVINGKDGRPVIIDPAAYYGHREMELGMTRLFGGFTSEFYRAYDSVYPLKPGWEKRMNLYILYHVLNHYNMFGGGYRSQALNLMKEYI